MADVKRTLIQERREAKGWSRRQFSDRVGITPGYVKVVEKMKVKPSAELLEKVSKELGIPYDRLVAEYRKQGVAPAAPPSRRRGRPRTKVDGVALRPKSTTMDARLAAPAPLAIAVQDELVMIALRSQQGVEMLLRAVSEKQQGRPARARTLVRQYQQTLAELVAMTARVAVSEAELRADEEESDAEPFRAPASSPST